MICLGIGSTGEPRYPYPDSAIKKSGSVRMGVTKMNIEQGSVEALVEDGVSINKEKAQTNLIVVDDELDDELGRLLRQLSTIPTWTKEKIDLYGEVEKEAKRQKYKSFKGDCRRYPLQRKGDHILCDVPDNKRGALAAFQGRRIRLICAGSWDQYSGRYYFAKPIKGA